MKKKGFEFFSLILLIHVFLLSFDLLAQAEIQESGVSVDLNDVKFIDEENGWCVGDSATIMATTDGGKTWNRQTSPVNNSIRFYDVEFMDRYNGWVSGDSGMIVYTNDSGKNWLKGSTNIIYGITKLSFINSDTGWASSKLAILRTNDGGKSWHKQLTLPDENSLPRKFTCIVFANKDKGWAFRTRFMDNFDPTYVHYTENGGEDWIGISEISCPIYGVSLIGEDTLWSFKSCQAISTDCGKNWDFRGPPTSDFVARSVATISASKAWIAAKYLIYTEDGMQTWTQLFPDVRYPIRALDNVEEKYLWAVGYSGFIMKIPLKNGLVDIEESQELHLNKDEILYQNFPNPFNNQTEIKFDLSVSQPVELNIFNLYGQKVRQLYNEDLNTGSYSVFWNGKNQDGNQVSAGLYL